MDASPVHRNSEDCQKRLKLPKKGWGPDRHKEKGKDGPTHGRGYKKGLRRLEWRRERELEPICDTIRESESRCLQVVVVDGGGGNGVYVCVHVVFVYENICVYVHVEV